MGTKDARVDAYIEKSEAFARPVLKHLRKIVHRACPDVEETMKWSFPHFTYKGVLCSMASFKAHCAFGFWKASLLAEKNPELAAQADAAMGQLGRITSIADLPDEATLLRYIRDAAALNEQGVKASKPERRAGSKDVDVPQFFLDALKRNKKAAAVFEAFSPSHKREYVEWVVEAKKEETRERRMASAIEWIAQGKGRNWKYEKNPR